MLEARKIPVRVPHDELTTVDKRFPAPVRFLLGREKNGSAPASALVVKCIDIRYLDLKIDASSKRLRQLAGDPFAADRLLDHDLGTLAIKINEALLRTVVKNAKAQNLDVKVQAAFEIGAIELRD